MTTGPLSVVIQQLQADAGPLEAGMTDGELLARFVGSRDEDALSTLIRRHASMVWGVCRRLLDHHEAEDAFQATFLVLVRKAPNVPAHIVANWLYGVARQTAVRLRATAAKRERRERQVVNMPQPIASEVRDADLQAVVDEELSRLPDRYRAVVVLCDLEGMTRKEAARQLDMPEGSVASRLSRAREMLARRLARRGIAVSGPVAVLSAGLASASAPPALVASTIKVAGLLAAGHAAGAVAVNVAALADGVVEAMFKKKIKSGLAAVMVIGLAFGGIGLALDLPTNPVAQAETPGATAVVSEGATAPVAAKKEDKPPHIVEKPDMKGRTESRLPCTATEDAAVVVKAFSAQMPIYPNIRFREFFDPRYLKKHGLTNRDIAFEIADHQGIDSLDTHRGADGSFTAVVVLDRKGGGKEILVLRCAVHEGHIYIVPETAPDPKTGIFKPWILRARASDVRER